EPEFEAKKPESKVNVSSSCSAQSKKHDDKTKKEAKEKSHVESLTGYRNLSTKFEDFSNNSSNEVNAVGTLVPTVRQNSPNSTNTFSADGPSNAADSPTYGKSSCIDASQYPNDHDMPELEDITYSDDDDDVGAEADFNNLETSILSAFIYGTIEEEVYVCQPLGFEDPDHPDKVYKVVKALYGLHQAPRACIPIDTEKPLLKDPDGEDVDVHTYRSMIGLLMYLTSSRPDIMFAVCACACFQVTPKASHLHTIKRILRYLKGKPHLGLWYLKDSPFDLVAYSDSDYAGASLDRKSTTKGVNTPRCDEDRLDLKELTVFLLLKVEKVRIGFWTTVAVKKVNDIIRLQALVDKKKVVVTEALIRDVLRLDDAEGVECLPNDTIFLELARMGYEKPSKKLTFYKFINGIYCHMLIFRVGKGFFGVETPLFEGMLVAQVVGEGVAGKEHDEGVLAAGDIAEGDVSAQPTPSQSPQVQPSSPQPQPQPQPTQDIRIPMNLLQDLMDTFTALSRRVEHLELDKIAQALEITKLKRRVKKLERGNKVKVLKLKRLQKVGTTQRINTSDDTVMDDASNQGRINTDQDAKEDETKPAEVQEVVEVVTTAKLIYEVTAPSDPITTASITVPVAAAILTIAPARATAAPSRRRNGVVIRDLEESSPSTIIPAETIDHAKEDPAMKKYQVLKKKPQTDGQARKNMIVYLNNVASFKMDYFKGMSYDDIRPIFEAKFSSNVAFLQKTKEHIKEEDNRALKRLNETQAEKAAKRKKLDEEVPVVGYEIINQNNKPYYKIIRADGTHQLYISFLTLLRNFNREDLEALWSLVKEKFSTTKPKNFSDDFLLVTLGVMFEKPDIHAQMWKNQRSVHGPAKVKGWKLLESCGVQIITFTTTQLILLVERKYPLTRFTLDQMLNAVRLKVKEESEVRWECVLDMQVTLHVLGQMTYPVTILTLDRERFDVMQGASFTQGMVSSIPIDGSISPKGFLLLILMLVVIIVTVVIVVVILIVVVAIIQPLGYVDSFLKSMSSLKPANESNSSFHTVKVERLTAYKLFVVPLFATGVSLGSSDLISDEDPTDEDGDTEVLVSLGEISSKRKKSCESDIGDCDNTGDGGKTAGRAIITWGGEIALYACKASIYGSACKGKKISMSKRYSVKSLRELFLGIVRKVRKGKSILNVEIRWDDNRVVG
nr:uncharacterized mitochondrial protein AtMg00810-like [Tanacetum cinerariifolium]